MLLLPFDNDDQKSLFVIVGHRHIRDYSKVGFQKNRPCIIHYNPNKRSVSRHNCEFVCDKLRTWLNIAWRKQHNDDSLLLQPFHKRSMPICRPVGKCSVQPCIHQSCHPTSYTNILPVQQQNHASDCGISIVQYALSMCTLGDADLLEKSYDKDGHHNLFSTMEHLSFTESNLGNLRKDILYLICNITEKYCTVRVDEDDSESISLSCQNCCMCDDPTSPVNLSCMECQPCDESDCSEMDNELITVDSGSVYVPDCEVENDDEGSLYGSDSQSNCSREDEDCSDCSYSGNRSQSHRCYNPTSCVVTDDESDDDVDDNTNDNLLCPGDMIEYRAISSSTIKKNSIVAINCNEKRKDRSSLVLKNGSILHCNKYKVRKIKMYNQMTGSLIPNPLPEWHPLERCLLQHGSVESHDEGKQSGGECSETEDDGSPDVPLPPRPPKKGGKKRRMRTSEGLTKGIQWVRTRRTRRQERYMDSAPVYPVFPWVEKDTDEYYAVIASINRCYRNMLKIGKAHDAFRKAKENVTNMLHAKTKAEFVKAERNISYRYDRHIKAGNAVLENFKLRTELIPDPRKYQNHRRRKIPTRRETMVNEQILTFEQYLSTLNVHKCSMCLECNIEEMPVKEDVTYVCKSCKDRKDPTFFLDNNLHPVWYLVNDAGERVQDENGKDMVQYHIPTELSSLTMSEKLLIRRCANFVPCVHLKNGVYGIKGHCIAYPQDITEMCNELPLRKESILTFIRNIGNKETDALFPTSLRVNKKRVIDALHWLKKHNQFYKDIIIKEENFDWMNGKDEVSIAREAVDLKVSHTINSKKKEDEEEYVSRCHNNSDTGDGTDIHMSAVHANIKQNVPTGRQAQPIKEFIEIAKETDQTSKVMKFPPIDHDSPIS